MAWLDVWYHCLAEVIFTQLDTGEMTFYSMSQGERAPQVGRRRMRRAPDERGATIPRERSLVPISMYMQDRLDNPAD